MRTTRLPSQGASQPASRAVVQELVTAVFDDERRQDDCHRDTASLAAQRFAREWREIR